MTFRGHVENGVIIIDDEVVLEDGVRVVIEITDPQAKKSGVKSQGRFASYRSLIGVIDDLPSDLSERHDDYLRGEVDD
jgi:hypothetical protein